VKKILFWLGFLGIFFLSLKMAAFFSLYPFNTIPHHSHSASSLGVYGSHLTVQPLSNLALQSHSQRLVVLSTHSNHKILKPNRRSRYGQALSPFDSDDEEVDDVDGEDDDDVAEDDSSSPNVS
jgi:mTERF domain-containing protein